MAKIQSSEIIQNAIKDLRLDAAREKVPTESSDKIVLTYPLSKLKQIQISDSSSTATTVTIKTFSTLKRTFVTGIHMSASADATADNTNFRFKLRPFGSNTDNNVMYISKQTTTALSAAQSTLNFNPPLEVAKGSNASMAASFTVGTVNYAGSVSYYEVEE